MFADDTMIYVSGNNINDMVAIVNNELNDFYKWLYFKEGKFHGLQEYKGLEKCE